MRHQPADKSQINRRPCFLSPTLGTDTTKYHLPKRDRLTCLGLDITDIRAHRIHDGAGFGGAEGRKVFEWGWFWFAKPPLFPGSSPAPPAMIDDNLLPFCFPAVRRKKI